VENAVRFLLSNFTLTFLVLGLLASGASLLGKPRPLTRAVVAEALLAYFLLCSVGVGFFYNFVGHVFFGEASARFIGWEDSPFQRELGFASLGFSAVGFLSFYGGPGLRLAAVVGPSCLLWGGGRGPRRGDGPVPQLRAGQRGGRLLRRYRHPRRRLRTPGPPVLGDVGGKSCRLIWPPEARLTRDAKASLERLAERAPTKP